MRFRFLTYACLRRHNMPTRTNSSKRIRVHGKTLQRLARELRQRNLSGEDHLKRFDDSRFTATVNLGGKAVSRVKISCGGQRSFLSGDNLFGERFTGRYQLHEQLSVKDNGYTLNLHPLGMSLRSQESLSVEGAAEYFWELFIKPLQE